MAVVATIIKSIIVDKFKVNESIVTPDAELTNDLGMDIFDFNELIIILEVAFNISIPNDDAREMHTVGDMVAYVEKVLNRN